MAGDVNKVTLMGNLGTEPRRGKLNSGDPVVSFRLATSETSRDKRTAELRTYTEWHDVVVFNEKCIEKTEYLHKGSRVYLEGRIQTVQWESGGKSYYRKEIAIPRYGGELKLQDRKAALPAQEQRQDEDAALAASKQREDGERRRREQLEYGRKLDEEMDKPGFWEWEKAKP